MNKTHRKGKAMAKKVRRRWRRRVGQALSSQGDDLPQCACPTCTKPAEFDSPNDLCEEHWTTWWEWPEGQPEPSWMERNPKPDNVS